MTDRYHIVRFYRDAAIRRRIISRGLTLKEARTHCSNPQTSSRTATAGTALIRPRRLGAWFDGYELEANNVRA